MSQVKQTEKDSLLSYKKIYLEHALEQHYAVVQKSWRNSHVRPKKR